MTKIHLELLKESFIGKKQTFGGFMGGDYTTIVTDHASQKKYLDLAIADKITQLTDDLRYLPSAFFILPGIASERDKSEKIDALQHLQSRIIDKNHAFDFLRLDPDVLDGETLELFKYAVQVHPYQFAPPEIRDLLNRDPQPRIGRQMCL